MIGAEDLLNPDDARLTSEFDPEAVPTIAWGVLVAGIGVVLAMIHAGHIGESRPAWALLIGVVVPFGISIGGIVPVGLFLSLPIANLTTVNLDFLRRIGPWVAGWMLLGMVWMGLAGAGSVLYQSTQSLFETQSLSLIAIFGSYGAIPGAITGYYYGRTAQAASEIAERERYLAVFSRVLRHNFRNQMNLLLGALDIASRSAHPPTTTHISRAETVGEDLMDTVEKQRFLVERVTEQKPPRPQRLSTVIETAVESVQTAYPESRLRVSDLNGETVLAHPEIDRAFVELLENAVCHSGEAHSRVEIGSRLENGSVVVSISDSGPAIPSTERAILTQDLEPDQLRHGSGLGLWIVDRLTAQSQGTLEIQQTPGGGNTVSLGLPVDSG